MAMFADFRRNEWASYFNDHADCLLPARAKLVAAIEEWETVRKRCGAYERPGFTVEGATARALDAIDDDLPEEIKDWLGAG